MEQQARTRSNRTQEEMFGLITKHIASHTTVKEFCKQQKLTEATFYYWRKKYHAKNNAPVGSQGGFAHIQIENLHSMMHPGLFAEVHGIKIYQAVSAAYLNELVSGVYVKP